ncbi:DUF4280 domain-containing protein [Cellulophaga sp. HaHa_2_1]|uniref:DUF4280 domain-containing protein n=1 Tax=Cellulophaga sp. HaHa_2_1 TaxID=2749994 RepID=UPI001C4EF05C|nr:DUF4280 domain-containing protein [Cellulophaga sp. HaHa_2_1]QXP52958.1 DUF4280 domain-containing protein [Cellulophaga sp. HaHa_2_1]
MSSEKFLVCTGAMCQCKQGFAPDSLNVLSQSKYYINDQGGSTKLIGNTMDLGLPFKAGTFGMCKLQPNGSSYNPCVPSIIGWDGAYEKAVLGNGGQILTEESKGICAIAGSPVIEFITNGQMGAPQASNFTDISDEIHQQLNPMVEMEKILGNNPFDNIQVELY